MKRKVDMETPTTLGSCGCVDYHMADCPTRTGYADSLSRDEYDDYNDEEERN